MAVGLILCVALLLSAELPGQLAAKDAELAPINQAVIDEAVARGIEFLKATQNDDGMWGKEGHIGYTAMAGIALIEGGVRINDAAVSKAAAQVRSKASGLTNTYQVSLAIIFLDRLKDPKRDDPLIRTLAARLIAGQTATGGWKYDVPKISDAEATQMITALKKMTPPPATISVSYRERPSSMGLCIKASDDIVVKPSAASIDLSEYEKKRVAIVNALPQTLKIKPVFQNPAKYDSFDPEDKRDLIKNEGGDNSNTHFAMIGLWAARRHDVPTERTFTLVARRFRTSQDPSEGGWGYLYPQTGSTPAMTCVGLLGLAIGNALSVDPGAGRPEQDPAILKSLAYVGKKVEAPTGKFTDRPKIKDAGGLYYFWALERIAVLYDIQTLDKKDWYRWGAEIIVADQLADGSWSGGLVQDAHPAPNTALSILFLKRANLTPDLSKRLIIDSSALTAKVNVPTPAPPPPPPPPPPKEEPKIDLSGIFTTPPKKEAPPVVAPVTPPSEPAPVKKEASILPWIIGGVAILATIGIGLFFALRKKKSDDDEEGDDEEGDDEEEKKPKKKAKNGAKVKKAK